MAVPVPEPGEQLVAHLGPATATVTREGDTVTVTFRRDDRDHLVVTYEVGDPNLFVELARLVAGPPPDPKPLRRPRRR